MMELCQKEIQDLCTTLEGGLCHSSKAGLSNFLGGFYARRVKRRAPALVLVAFAAGLMLALCVPPALPFLDEYYRRGCTAISQYIKFNTGENDRRLVSNVSLHSPQRVCRNFRGVGNTCMVDSNVGHSDDLAEFIFHRMVRGQNDKPNTCSSGDAFIELTGHRKDIGMIVQDISLSRYACSDR